MENTVWCEDECTWDCVPTSSTLRKAATNQADEYNEAADWNTGYAQCQNIASRMSQKEALAHAQASFFVAIVIVQWADLIICKTRLVGSFDQRTC